jgi:integrase
MKLTATTLPSAKLPDGKSECIVFDDGLPGFGLRIREGGSRTFIYQYQLGSKQRRMSLGVATESNVNNIRKTAEKLHARVKLGEDPATTKVQARVSAMHTFRVVAEQYLEHHKSGWRPRSYINTIRNLLTYAKVLHQLPLDKITRADVAAVHASVTKEIGATTANRVRSSLSGLFTWAIENGRAEVNPVINSPRHEEISRDRVLTPNELRLIWNNLEDDDYGAIIKLVALTGQRPGEITGLRWSQIHNGSIVLEGGDATAGTKNYRDHVIPLSEPARQIIAGRKRTEGCDLIFGRGEKLFANWTKTRKRVNKRIAAATGHQPRDWRPHDLRRTFSTMAGGGLAEHDLEKLTGRDKKLASGLGIAPHVVEAVLNHISGHKAGVAGTYKMTPEEAEAYERDVELAAKLLDGIYQKDRDGFLSGVEYLSATTKPTEEEARAALARVLMGKPTLLSEGIMWSLARLFDPQVGQAGPPARKLVFETINHQYATAVHNFGIARRILYLMEGDTDGYAPREGRVVKPGKEWDESLRRSYDEAAAEVAEKFGISERHAKRIYSQTFLKGQRPKRRLRRRTKHKPRLRVVK